MSQRRERAERLCARGVVAVVRAGDGRRLPGVAGALLAGGVDCIEITMTAPNALEAIAACRASFEDQALVGVGSVLDGETARRAVDAGAGFVVSPVTKTDVIEAGHAADAPVVPGCFTPTEMLAATEAGADIVKVFPAGMFGPKYFKAVLAPMPHLKLMPTGGVNPNTAAAWIEAGAVTLGVGSALVTKAAVDSEDFGEIERLAGEYVRIVAEARANAGAA